MERPEPDGYAIITLRENYQHHAAYVAERTLRYNFRDVKCFHQAAVGLQVRFDNRIITYPWNAIQEYVHQFNSETYMAELHAYQEQHEHTWVCNNEYSYGPGMNIGFEWHCGSDSFGIDQGCGKIEYRKIDDLGHDLEYYQRQVNGEF